MTEKIVVVIATVGRSALAQAIVCLLAEQTRRPDFVVVVGAKDDDVAAIGHDDLVIEKYTARPGLCMQRNKALEQIGNRTSIITFLDDDFVPEPSYLQSVIDIFAQMPDVVGITGDLVADGAKSAGYSIEEAKALLAGAQPAPGLEERKSLYGCNMSIRWDAARDLRFDEHLPLYGWQEDTDFTTRLGARGRLIRSSAVTGVHMGVKFGKTSGKRLGYSQIANLIYLMRKGTIHFSLARRLLFGNVFANVFRSLWPEHYIDRRGRLLGNVIALKDLISGNLDPRKVERM